MFHVCHISGGVTSWAAAKLVAQEYGTEKLLCLFADTYFEDEDSYRFIVESTANIYGVPVSAKLVELACKVPTHGEGTSDDRKLYLIALAKVAQQEINGLIWIAEGRNPWEVFADEKFLGNSRIDPCSRVLKRQFLDRWVMDNVPEDATHYVGFDYEEGHRAGPLRKIFNERGQVVKFPLLDNLKSKIGAMEWLASEGIKRPKLYDIGLSHNNCGGLCVKQGQKGYNIILKEMPKRFVFAVREEKKMRDQLGNVSILRDRRGGESKPLSLDQFRTRQRMGQGCDETDLGACSCMAVDDADNPA